jgi:hypothetical protein
MADVIDTLNDLISSCRDSEEGFGKAAKGCHNDDLRNRFIGIARQRTDFADELTAQVRELGGRARLIGPPERNPARGLAAIGREHRVLQQGCVTADSTPWQVHSVEVEDSFPGVSWSFVAGRDRDPAVQL